MELVSVIVPTKDSSRYLARCLDSIQRQTYEPIEIIVVDNRSTDLTKEIAHRYTSLVFEWGPERSAQVNYGARRANGEYVYKVDSDFVLEPEVVASCVAKAHAGCDAVVVHNSPDVTVSWIARIRKFEVDMYKFDITHSSARFVRRQVFESVGGFNEHITAGEDYDFQNRLDIAGYRTGFVSPEALHLGEPTSFWAHMIKYFRYGSDFVVYSNRNPGLARRQLRFFRPVYLRHWRSFLNHPLLGAAFAAYNVCKYAFGSAGFAVGTIRRRATGGSSDATGTGGW
jgi:glycosyltransferase involved in cell wall biosynthesis